MFDDHLQDILAKYDYPLNEKKIANQPVFPRDSSKLLVLDRQTGMIEDYHFCELVDFLSEKMFWFLNETKVFAARLFGKKQSGGKVELLLIKQINLDTFEASSQARFENGSKIIFSKKKFFESDDSLLADLDSSDFFKQK
jgi:S-adenosylmethionine:tRNA ribosyltransferase-isomerase